MNAVLTANRLNPAGNFRIPVGGQVREHVVLHLIAKMPAQDMQPAAPGEVRGPGELAQVPVTLALTLAFLLREGFRILGKVATENHRG